MHYSMFQLGHDFTYLASQWLFLCATCLDLLAKWLKSKLFFSDSTIGGPIQRVVSYRDQCARKHTS